LELLDNAEFGVFEMNRNEKRKRSRFIWQYGVKKFGVPVGLVMTVLAAYHNMDKWPLFSVQMVVGIFVGFVVSAIIGGYTWGWVFWALGGGRSLDLDIDRDEDSR
jgi:hypothetical protein